MQFKERRIMKAKRIATWAAATVACLCVSVAAEAADTIRMAIQRTGTVAWEIAVMKARGLDKAANLDIETTELASTEAAKIALEGGATDMIVSDWLWVQRERSLGDKLVFTPYSTALGAVMVEPDSPIHTIADLAKHSIGVAGGPLDKSWLMLQAAAKRQGVDLTANEHVAYGAPPLIYEMFRQGEIESALEFWNFCVDMETHGLRRAIDMVDVEKALGATGPVAMTGYVFNESFADSHRDALRRYFEAAAKARNVLAEDPNAWAPIKEKLKIADDAALAVYRRRYLEGATKRPLAAEAADAKALFLAMAGIGGKELVGDATELDSRVFYDPH
jgi:NitT/TauT family transport system substrate-binding protein